MLVKTPPRTIVVIWRDLHGREHRGKRVVYFERGMGPHVRWNKHTIPVGAMDTELRVDIPGPTYVDRRRE